MTEKEIDALYAHAGELVKQRKSLAGVFEFLREDTGTWCLYLASTCVPSFESGDEWRIAQPKKQLIDWTHPYFKGCATNYGELVRIHSKRESFSVLQRVCMLQNGRVSYLCLAKPANEDSNWQSFFSTPENDKKLRELAKMVKVEVRYWNRVSRQYEITTYSDGGWVSETQALISTFRITGLQDGWTDNPEEVKS